MADQDHALSRNRQVPAALGRQGLLKIEQTLIQGNRTIKGLASLQQLLNRTTVAPGVFEHRHGPPRTRQPISQPMKMLRIPTETGHHQNPCRS